MQTTKTNNFKFLLLKLYVTAKSPNYRTFSNIFLLGCRGSHFVVKASFLFDTLWRLQVFFKFLSLKKNTIWLVSTEKCYFNLIRWLNTRFDFVSFFKISHTFGLFLYRSLFFHVDGAIALNSVFSFFNADVIIFLGMSKEDLLLLENAVASNGVIAVIGNFLYNYNTHTTFWLPASHKSYSLVFFYVRYILFNLQRLYF